MKTIITLFTVLGIHYSFAQFHRTFLNTQEGVNVLKTKIVDTDDDSIRLASISYSSVTNPILKISTIAKDGELIRFKEFPLSLSNLVGSEIYISAVFKRQNSFIVALNGHTNTIQHFALIELNQISGQIIQSHVNTTDFKTGYSEAIILNNEVVNYFVKSTGGLYRIGNALNSFSTASEILVDNSITSAGSYSSLVNAKKFSHTILFQGKELTAINQTGNVYFYSWDLPSTFSIHIVGTAQLSGVSLINENDTSFVLMDAYSYYRLNSNYSTISTNTYNTTPNTSVFHVLRKPNGEYLVSIKASNSQNFIQHYSTQFQLLEQNKSYQIVNGPGKIIGNLNLFYGITDRLTTDLYQNGQSTNQKTVALLAIKDGLNYEPIKEYNYPFVKDNVSFNAGIGDKALNLIENSYSAAKFGNAQSLMATLCQIHQGLLSNGDTVGKPNDPFSSQSRVGPYTTPALYNDIIEAKYNRGFYVTRKMIEDHIDSIQSNSSSYVPIRGILNWPGNGNPNLGQTPKIAGFFDGNGNSIYEPLLGEYPSIFGDECFLQISHDHPNMSHPGGVENHTYFYSYYCDTSDYLTNTIFIKTKYFLRTQTIEDFSTGVYIDFDNGNPTDDYSGTHVELAMIYNYNGDMHDENYSGLPGFIDTLVAQGLMVLKGNKLDNDGIDNPLDASPIGCTNGLGFGDGIIDNEYHTLERSFSYTAFMSQNMDPYTLQDWSNVAQGYWTDGSPQFYGANGNMNYGPTTSYKSKFVYPGGSDTLYYGTGGIYPGFDWTEFAPTGPGSIPNAPQDRRMYSYQGTSTLNQGDSLEIDMVYVVVTRPNTGSDSITSILPELFAKADNIKKAYIQNSSGCGINFNTIPNDLSVNESTFIAPVIYPNPSTGVYKIQGLNGFTAKLNITDITGKFIRSTSITEGEFIDLSPFEGNVFFVKLELGTNTVSYRLIKM